MIMICIDVQNSSSFLSTKCTTPTWYTIFVHKVVDEQYMGEGGYMAYRDNAAVSAVAIRDDM